MAWVYNINNRISYSGDDNITLCQEIDSVRILSTEACKILIRVPDSVLSIKSIGSTSPGALLFDAIDAYNNGSAKADENIRSIIDDGGLNLAIENCIDAASHELDPIEQKQYLKAASYGKCFDSDENTCYDHADLFVNVSKILRVLNSLCNVKVFIIIIIII